MHVHFLSALLVFAFVAGSVPLSFVHPSVGGVLSPTAEAKSRVRSLLDRVRGNAMPEGIIKTNGRIEAIQVDVAAKYPGRLVDITVEEGSEVKAGQVVGRVSSPEYEAQLRAAQSNVERAKQSRAEAESLIDQR
ncbi:MAG: biotin/lipoyl-binding protein, partial [Rhodoplanes sp.]